MVKRGTNSLARAYDQCIPIEMAAHAATVGCVVGASGSSEGSWSTR